MTDEEVMNKYEAMEKYFGELPNFEHHPRQFAYYVRMYDYYKSKIDENPEME